MSQVTRAFDDCLDRTCNYGAAVDQQMMEVCSSKPSGCLHSCTGDVCLGSAHLRGLLRRHPLVSHRQPGWSAQGSPGSCQGQALPMHRGETVEKYSRERKNRRSLLPDGAPIMIHCAATSLSLPSPSSASSLAISMWSAASSATSLSPPMLSSTSAFFMQASQNLLGGDRASSGNLFMKPVI